MRSMTYRGKTFLICCAIALLLPGLPAAAMSGHDSPIDRVLKRLPADAFDDTTDGISDADLRKLVETGETTDWKLKRLDDQSAVATDKNPHTNSEVSIHVIRFGHDHVVEVAVQNEYRHTEHYLKMGAQGGLNPFSPPKKLKRMFKSE